MNLKATQTLENQLVKLFVVTYFKGRWKTKTNFSSLEKAQIFIESLNQKNSATIQILTISI
jgi:hypothetical protein